jgi:hypothetical protein
MEAPRGRETETPFPRRESEWSNLLVPVRAVTAVSAKRE